ncbi:hypothetical protein BH20CHL6_BH20CHL6_17980 [soil metagenome]
MSRRPDTTPLRGLRHEPPGTVDGPFDDDTPSGAAVIRSDAACSVAWRADGFEAIQVFVDPVLTDRARELCSVVEMWSTAHRDLTALNEAVMAYARDEQLSASVYEDPQDDLSTGVVAIAFTLG